jgi:hypothetical protein
MTVTANDTTSQISWPNGEDFGHLEKTAARRLSGFAKINGRPEWTRTIDLLRVREAL